MNKNDLKVGEIYKHADRHHGFGYKCTRIFEQGACFDCVIIGPNARGYDFGGEELRAGVNYGIGNEGIESLMLHEQPMSRALAIKDIRSSLDTIAEKVLYLKTLNFENTRISLIADAVLFLDEQLSTEDFLIDIEAIINEGGATAETSC